jgi:hypothetical protein
LNVVYSYYVDELSTLGSIIPPNKCVALFKLELEKKTKFSRLRPPKIKKEEEKPKKEEKKTEEYTTQPPPSANITEPSTANITESDNVTEEIETPEEETLVEEVEKEEEKPREELKNILVVGDSLGEGLYLAYKWKLPKNLKKCLNIKFLVRRSTTTKTWLRNKKFFEELEKGDYDTLVIVLGANEWGIDKTTLYYNIMKFCLKVRETNPDIDIYWIVPSTKNEYLKKYVEECVGPDHTIAIGDYEGEIPLSKDKVHPDMKRRGYTKLWYILLQKILTEKVLNCQN